MLVLAAGIVLAPGQTVTPLPVAVPYMMMMMIVMSMMNDGDEDTTHHDDNAHGRPVASPDMESHDRHDMVC